MHFGPIHIMIFRFLLIALLFASCSQNEKETIHSGVDYAEILSITEGDGYYQVDIHNPWMPGKLLQRLILIDGSTSEALPDGQQVRIPLSRSLVMTTVHCSLLEELGCLDNISSVCDAPYINSSTLKDRIATGCVVDCGNSVSPSIEKIITVRPDAILMSPYEYNDLTKLDNLNIPIIMCADYMETTPLGRAEWIKFYALLFGAKEKGDSIFSEVAASYNSMKSKVSAVTFRPLVLSEKCMGSQWYVPGPKSTFARMYLDAGADSPFPDRHSRKGSLCMSPEQVLHDAQKADVWLLKSDADITLQSLAAERNIYTQFQPYKTRNVWCCNTMTTAFYEKVPFHPDLLLADLIRIFHPEVAVPGENVFYFKAR